jgi:hypothetical protein
MNMLTFSETVAVCCGNGIEYTSISVKTVSAVKAAALFDNSVERNLGASDSSVAIDYVIAQSVAGYSDPKSAGDSILANLANSIDSGLFNEYLHAFAAANGASALGNATSSNMAEEVTSSPTLAPTTIPNSGAPKGLSQADIAAIAVTSAFGVGLIVAVVLIWFMCCRNRLSRRISRKDLKLPNTPIMNPQLVQSPTATNPLPLSPSANSQLAMSSTLSVQVPPTPPQPNVPLPQSPPQSVQQTVGGGLLSPVSPLPLPVSPGPNQA